MEVLVTMSERYRIAHDSLDELRVPARALYGAQTQRAVEDFTISGLHMPGLFIRALGRIKSAAARVNVDLGLLDTAVAVAISTAADEIAAGQHEDQFPVDVFQTGSGTSTNMNANDVIATLTSIRSGLAVHSKDDINLGQNSNDVIPGAIHVSTCLDLHNELLLAMGQLRYTLESRAAELSGTVKTGRTHFMGALPVRLDQELGV